MPTAQLNIRVPAEHHDLMRDVAARLRQDKDFAEALTAFVASVAMPAVSTVASGSIASILARLESVEAQLVDLRQKPASAPLNAVELDDTPITPEALPEPPQERQTRKRWTEADYAVLRRIAAEGGTQAEAVRELGRPDGSVSEKWRELGLPVPPRKGRKLTRPPSPSPAANKYRVTQHKGRGPDSKSAHVIFSHPDEARAYSFYNATLPAAGTTVAMRRPDGSLVAHRSGPPTTRRKGKKGTPPT